MVYDETAHDGFAFASTDSAAASDGPGGMDPAENLSLSEALGGGYANVFLRVGGEYVLILRTYDGTLFYETWPNYSPQNPEHPRPEGPTWCGLNTEDCDSFVLFDNERPPDPANADQVHYRIGVRCTRLLLVKNAMFKADGTIDFSKATIRGVEHGAEGFEGNKIQGINRLNSERPLFYKRGAGRERGIVLDDPDVFHFPPVDNAADPWSDDGSIDLYRSPVYVPVTKRDGIGFPESKIDPGVDFPNKWPAYTYRRGKLDNQGNGKVKARYWDSWSYQVDEPTGDGSTSDNQQPLKALKENPELVKIFHEFNLATGILERPFAIGTAFDMVLAVRTKHWRRYRAVMHRYDGKHGEDCYNGKWVYDTHGYFNSDIAGWIYQLAPTKPKGA